MMYRATCGKKYSVLNWLCTVVWRFLVTHSVDIGVVQCCIDLVQDKKGSRLVAIGGSMTLVITKGIAYSMQTHTCSNYCSITFSFTQRQSLTTTTHSVATQTSTWLVPVYGEEESQGSHSFLSTWEIVHWSKPLPRSYAVVANTLQVWFLLVNIERSLAIGRDTTTHFSILRS